MVLFLFMRDAEVKSLCWFFFSLYHEFVLFIAEENPKKVMGLSLSFLADFFESSNEIDVLLPLIKDQSLKGVYSDL